MKLNLYNLKTLMLCGVLIAGTATAKAGDTFATVGHGKTYTSLAAWETAVSGNTSNVVDAECYATNLGTVVLSTWTNTPTSNNPLRIYAATNQGTTVSNVFDGPRIDVNIAGTPGLNPGSTPNVHVEGIAFQLNSASSGSFDGFYIVHTSGDPYGYEVTGCKFIQTGGLGTSYGIFLKHDVNAASTNSITPYIIARNNIFYGISDSSGQRAIFIENENDGTNTKDFQVIIQNNTCEEWFNGFLRIVSDKNSTGTTDINLTLENNVGIGGFGDDYLETLQSGTVTLDSSKNNIDGDGSVETHWSGTGNLINKTAAATWDNPGTNLSPKSTGTAYDGGITISAITDDFLGTSRPQGPSYDIGAIEAIQAVAALTRRIITLSTTTKF